MTSVSLKYCPTWIKPSSSQSLQTPDRQARWTARAKDSRTTPAFWASRLEKSTDATTTGVQSLETRLIQFTMLPDKSHLCKN